MHIKQLLYSACRICFSTVTAALLLSQISFCQITFFKTYGDTADDHSDKGYAVLQTEDGGYIAAGEYGNYFKLINHRTYYYGDVYLVKTNEYGDTLWTKTYGDTGAVREGAYSMDNSSDGGYIICAYNETTYKLWLIKIDSQGDSIWTKKYQLGYYDAQGVCIKKVNDEGYIITGSISRDNPFRQYDIFLLKTNSKGDSTWLRTYDNNNNPDHGFYVQQTSDSGYIIAASGLFIKTDSKGDTIWTKIYPGLPHSIYETKDGGYFIAGEYVEQPCEGCELELHILLLRTDSNGDTLWTRKINNGSYGDYAYAMKRTSDGGSIIAGETSYNYYDTDIYLLKLDEEGNYQWSSVIGRNLGETGDEKHYRGYDVEETSDGGYIITGLKWIYIGWYEYLDLCLVKVNDKGQLTGVNEAETKIPSYFELLQNYPNPFNSETVIRFSVAYSSRVRIDVFDMLGRRVDTIADSYFTPGQYSVRFVSHSLSSGIYFYRMQANEFYDTRKFVVVR
jgi:hypothetical protein